MKRFLLASLLLPVVLFAYTSPGKPTGFVNDFAKLLKPATVTTLNQDLTNFSSQTGNEISVVTVTSLGGDTIENYAVKLFEEWKIGKAKEDNGLLLLISKNDREMRIEVGYGLEPEMTDIESSHIISDVLAPKFKDGDYDGGVLEAVARIEADITNGAPVTTENHSANATPSFNIPIYFVVIIFAYLASVLGRSKSWWAGGVIGGVGAIALGFLFTFIVGILAAVVLIPLGLLFDFIVSRAYQKHKDGGPRPPWFLGGGGFGGGGGGFGGFGGGSSGGGGASGRW